MRSALFMVATTAGLAVCFYIYTVFLGQPAGLAENAPTQAPARPNTPPGADGSLVINGVPLQPGSGSSLAIYDDRTGDIKQRISFSDWRKAPDAEDRIFVTNPGLAVRLGAQRTLAITADNGELDLAGLDMRAAQPRSGRLWGAVRIVLDRRALSPAGAADGVAAEEADAQIAINLAELEFDADAGLLRSSNAVHVASPAYELTGVGLELVWNDAAERLELLRLGGPGELILLSTDELIPHSGANEDEPAAPAQASNPDRRGTTYRCVLREDVSLRQYREVGEVLRETAGLDADELALLLDVSGERSARVASRLAGGAPAPSQDAAAATTQPTAPLAAAVEINDDVDEEPPATQPTAMSRAAARWSGPLEIRPTDATPGDQPRRRLHARGDVRLFRGDDRIWCGELEVHDETSRIWLRPSAGGDVRLTVGRDVFAQGREAFLDLNANQVKVLGPVSLEQRGAQPFALAGEHWLELELISDRDAPPADNLLTEQLPPVRRASVSGQVELHDGAQRLSADHLDITFASRTTAGPANAEQPQQGGAIQPEGEPAPQSLSIERAIATGNVSLTTVADQPDEALADLARGAFAIALGEPYAALAAVQQRFQCARVVATFTPDPNGNPRIHSAIADGGVQLFDRAAQLAASGRRLDARFDAEGNVATADITGDAALPASALLTPYTLQASRIEVTPSDGAMRAPGPAQVSFVTGETLLGRIGGPPTRVIVSSRDELLVSANDNVVRFRGDVQAVRGSETLVADTLTLHLRDRADTGPSVAPTATPANSAFDFGASGTGLPRDAKQPHRLTATAARVTSATYAPRSDDPVMESRLLAPQLEVDIPRNLITTTGETVLGMISRRLPTRDPNEQAPRSRDATASGLLTRGPSQTVIGADDGLVYAIGAGDDRREDHALFQGGVRFVHLAGREMQNPETVLPALRESPALLDQLESRMTQLAAERLECHFAVADDDPAVAVRRAAAGPPLQLMHLIATGDVLLVDRVEQQLRQIDADRIEYDGVSEIARALASADRKAIVRTENLRSGMSSQNEFADAVELDLRAGDVQVRSRRDIQGQVVMPDGASR